VVTFAYQPALRPALPCVYGPLEYREQRALFERIDLNRVRFRISTFLELPAGLQIQLGEQFLDGELVVSGHGFQDAA